MADPTQLPRDATPISGRVFEDTLDGYFPLEVSMQQMLERNSFAAAWVLMLYAPVMDIPDLDADAPVPLKLNRQHAGLIDEMDIVARAGVDRAKLSGVGAWRWVRPRSENTVIFPPSCRLSEPIFIRGIGFHRSDDADIPTQHFGRLAHAIGPTSLAFVRSAPGALPVQRASLGWNRVAVWSPFVANNEIHARDAVDTTHAHFGTMLGSFDTYQTTSPAREFLLIDASHPDPVTQALIDRT